MPSIRHLLASNGTGSIPKQPTREVMVEWLMKQSDQSLIDPYRQQVELFSLVTPGTGAWIFEAKQFQRWKDESSPSKRLAMYGNLGSGKTMLLSLIVDSAVKQSQTRNDFACVYFYFQEGDEHPPSASGIWANLLRQLLQHQGSTGIVGELKAKFSSSLQGSIPLHSLEYFDLFRAQAVTFKTVYLIIDALDNCLDAHGEKTRQHVQDALRKMPDNIRVLFSSRGTSLAHDLGITQELYITPKASDVKTYVKSRIDADVNLRRVLEDSQHIEDVVGKVTNVTLASGMFLLARLHLDNLSEQGTLADIKSAMRQLPIDLNRAFDSAKFDIISKQADLEMAKTCLAALLLDQYGCDSGMRLLPYAASHWSSHLGHGCRSADSEAQRLICTFLGDSRKLTRAFEAIPELRSQNFGRISGLHATVFFGLQGWAKRLIKRGVDVNARDSNGETALHWAVRYGRRKLLEYLIHEQADANIADLTGDTPLHKYLTGPMMGDTRVAGALVQGGARLDVEGAKGLTPLSSAIRYGPTSIAKLFIMSQADVNEEVTKGWTSLREVFLHGHEAYDWGPLRHAVEDHIRYLMHLLLGRGVNLNSPTTEGWLPLIHAVRTGSLTTIRSLLETKPSPADINLRDPKEGKSPLRWAFFYKQGAIIRLLIEYGADVNETNNDGWKPLTEAVAINDQELVWLLLKKGARPDELDNNNDWPALLYAIKSRNKDIAWLLITNGANVNRRNDSAPSPIDLAMANDDFSIAWLLCEHGANIDSADFTGVTALRRACDRGHLEGVSFLLDKGANISSKDKAGSTPLHHAVLMGLDDIVTLLASRGSRQGRLDVQDAQDNTALMLATLRKNRFMVQSLLRHSASSDIQDSHGLTALHHAARLGFDDGLRLLMHEADNVDLADNQGYTAVHHAVSSPEAGRGTINVLAKQGAGLEVEERGGLTPLMLAVHLGRKSIARKLLEDGANVDTWSSKGWTAAGLVRKGEYPDIARLLERATQNRLSSEY
ncbi:hypothetical protein QQX98_001477 [Neonectria punicea]|uniref:NACHT domain-containing protein n=1 Tax=Neonectria punicea TaxID=979145 RepID=A0ABR1HPE8_9HYPO